MADMFIEIESRGESFEISVTQITINANLLEQWFLTGVHVPLGGTKH